MFGLTLSKEKRKPTLTNDKGQSKPISVVSTYKQDQYEASNQTVQTFSFTIQSPLQDDPSCYWSYNIPFLKPNQKGVTLATFNFQTILTNYIGDDFPQKISFGFRNFSGYSDKQGSPTTTFLVLNLVSTTIKTQMGLTSRDLIYRSQMQNVWSLGALRNLQLQIYLDDSSLPLTQFLTSPVELCFKLIHVHL